MIFLGDWRFRIVLVRTVEQKLSTSPENYFLGRYFQLASGIAEGYL
jgi:hypothetical protein